MHVDSSKTIGLSLAHSMDEREWRAFCLSKV